MTWWRRGVIYEIYPRSFQDSDGDGIGDLALNAHEPNPMLELHRRLIALRRGFAEEDYRTLHADGVLAYARGDRTAVALNLTGEPRPLPVAGETVLSTHLDGGSGGLRAAEGVVLRI